MRVKFYCKWVGIFSYVPEYYLSVGSSVIDIKVDMCKAFGISQEIFMFLSTNGTDIEWRNVICAGLERKYVGNIVNNYNYALFQL